MLFENDGFAADAINAYTMLYGDGAVMDALRRRLAVTPEAEQAARAEFAAIACRVKESKVRKVENATGLTAVASIPLQMYHGFAAAYKMKCEEEGIVLEGNGYECWSDDHFLAFIKRQCPELFYAEAPRNACIIVNEHGHLSAA